MLKLQCIQCKLILTVKSNYFDCYYELVHIEYQ